MPDIYFSIFIAYKCLRYVWDLPEVGKQFAQLLAWDLPKMCLILDICLDLPKVCQIIIYNLPEIKALDLPENSMWSAWYGLKLAWDIPQICSRFSRDLSEICKERSIVVWQGQGLFLYSYWLAQKYALSYSHWEYRVNCFYQMTIVYCSLCLRFAQDLSEILLWFALGLPEILLNFANWHPQTETISRAASQLIKTNSSCTFRFAVILCISSSDSVAILIFKVVFG